MILCNRRISDNHSTATVGTNPAASVFWLLSAGAIYGTSATVKGRRVLQVLAGALR